MGVIRGLKQAAGNNRAAVKIECPHKHENRLSTIAGLVIVRKILMLTVSLERL